MNVPSASYWCRLVILLPFLAPALALAALDQGFQPIETLVSDPDTYPGIVDPEFDSATAQFCWVDRFGDLWVGSVDPQTGLLVPPDGRGARIDTDVVTVGERINGPEWVSTAEGPDILYSKHFGSGKYLVRATYANGRWVPRRVDKGHNRFAPMGTLDQGDPQPAMSYLGSSGSRRPAFVRMLDDAASEQMIPTTDAHPIPVARWVPNRKAVAFVRPTPTDPAAPSQIFLYDMADRTLEQLTSDTGAKEAVFMWQAPEYGYEYVFFALLEGRAIGIYRNLDLDGDGQHTWTRIQTLDPPSTGDFIWSPEPFVYEGHSYIVMVTSTSDDQTSVTVPTEIWLADLDPSDPLYRRLSDERELVRMDPEVFFAAAAPLIYAMVTDGPVQTIYRLDTGLTPQ